MVQQVEQALVVHQVHQDQVDRMVQQVEQDLVALQAQVDQME